MCWHLEIFNVNQKSGKVFLTIFCFSLLVYNHTFLEQCFIKNGEKSIIRKTSRKLRDSGPYVWCYCQNTLCFLTRTI